MSWSGDNYIGGLPKADPHMDRHFGPWGCPRIPTARTPEVPHSCRSVRSNRSKHGGRLPRLQSIQNRCRQPVPWVPPIAPESAIKRTRSGTERRARTTAVAILASTQNGTSGVQATRCHVSADSGLTTGARTPNRHHHWVGLPSTSRGQRPDRRDMRCYRGGSGVAR